MRKYINSFWLSILVSLSVNAQTEDITVWKKVDSLKKELRTAKGETKINCLNRLAEYYYGIWDEDDKLRDTACIFSSKAYEEAAKIKYKEGIAYALSNRAMCAMAQTDNDRNNNDKEPAYSNAYKEARLAIKYAADLNSNYIIGNVYDNLRWMEKWRGTPEKLKMNTEQAILHFEKVNNNDFKEGYKPLVLINCSGCKGTENILGGLYLELSRTQTEFNSTMKEQIEKAIFYFQKAGPNSGLGSAYMAYGIFMSLTNDLEIGIDYLKKAISEFGQNNSKRSELIALIELSGFYSRSGDFENGLVYGKKTVQVAESILKLKDAGDADSLRVGQSYYWMGKFYSIAGDYETAFSYMRKARYFYPDEAGFLNPWTIAMGDLYLSTEKYDSAMYYLKSFENKTQGRPILSKLYIALKQYDKALGLLNEEIKVASNRNNQSGLGSIYIIAAKAYFGKNDYVTALKNANEGITLLKKIKSSAAMIGAYNLLSRIYNELGKNDSAYFYLRQSTVLKDSLLNRQFFIRLNDLKKEAEEERKTSQINLLNKDNQLKEQKLKQQATLRNSLIIGILLLFLLGVFVFRTLLLKRKNDKLRMQKDLELQQLENQKKQAELHQRAVELEMQALRAQMNPHFIFNCLSSINRFIFKNDNKTASDYLTRFSRLIRMVLMHSQKKLIPLEDELEMIRLYLDLERLRFKDAFDYSITTTNIVDPGTVFIPPIILQPFCENAVWHGLMHKENKGHLNIVISEVINENDKTLHCIIEDDGVGREKAAEMKSKSAGKEKSLGLKITTERIALLNKENNFNTFYKIDDILNDEHEVAGTRVQLKIKHKESVEEYT